MRRTVLVLVLVLAACGGPSGDEPTVLAAASLTGAFTELGGAELHVAGSTALARQIRDGAPADVFASADEETMQGLVDDGLVEEPIVFAANSLAIVVAPGNPEGITRLADLTRDDLTVVLVDPSVPAGAYTRRALTRASLIIRARSYELDVKAAVAKVTAGEADATIAYASDLATAGADADGFVLPKGENVGATYPVAVVRGGDRDAARAYIDRLLSDRGRATLERHGFLPPP